MKQQVESSFRWVIGAVLLIVLAMFLGSVAGRRHSTGKPHEGEAAPSREVSESLHEVSIRRPAGPPRMSLKTAAGETVTVACTNCHANRPADVLNTKPEHLDEFHQNLKVSHGKIACLSCHNSDNYDALKLANGESVDFENVMQLCVQCHGNKGKDFENGAHGGMTGDFSVGYFEVLVKLVEMLGFSVQHIRRPIRVTVGTCYGDRFTGRSLKRHPRRTGWTSDGNLVKRLANFPRRRSLALVWFSGRMPTASDAAQEHRKNDQ